MSSLLSSTDQANQLVREAGFHILITSYQLLVSDEKYFRRVKWQYMVLDEAQAIKSSNRSKALNIVLLDVPIPIAIYPKRTQLTHF